MTPAFFARQLARRGQSITLQGRAIVPPDFEAVDFDQSFSAPTSVKALIDTRRGSTLFDGVSTDTPITHKFCIAYRAGVTAETGVLFDGRQFDVVDVENYQERNFCLILSCSERGTAKAAQA